MSVADLSKIREELITAEWHAYEAATNRIERLEDLDPQPIELRIILEELRHERDFVRQEFAKRINRIDAAILRHQN